MKARRPRPGIALFAALSLLTLLAILIVGGVATASLAERSVRASRDDAVLSAGGDYAVNTVLADPVRYGLATLPLGAPTRFSIPTGDVAGSRADVVATRLANDVLWIVADVRGRDDLSAHRRINVVAAFPALVPIPQAVVVARGGVRVGSDVRFTSDSIGDADCRGAAAADLELTPAATLSIADSTRVSRQPRAADSSTYYFGSPVLAALTGRTVLRTAGDTTLTGGRVDGILIVNGSLTIAGAVQVTGFVVARGPIVATAGVLNLSGAMLSFAPAAPGAWAVDLAHASLRYSRCDIRAAVRGASVLKADRERGWAELF